MSDVSYQAEQEKLAQERDGQRLIDIPSSAPEVNPELYKDIEPILFRGFLHTTTTINGVRFVFKSVNHHELARLRFEEPQGFSTEQSQRFNALFLAYGVLMIDGQSVLRVREHWMSQVADLFYDLGEAIQKRVVIELGDLNRRANRATTLTEAYAMENASRLRWAQLRGLDLASSSVTGIEGTDKLGLNWAQLTWRAINYYEDQRDNAEREWENAKFVASAMAGKGMQKVHNDDRRRKEQERNAKQERKDRLFRYALLGESLDVTVEKGTPIRVARSVEELATQLERDLKGEKDWHDRVVDEHDRKVREAQERRSQQLQAFQQSYEEQYGSKSVIGSSDMQGLTPEEVKYQITRRKQITAQRLASLQVHPEFADQKQAEFANKWRNVITRVDR
jgi:hypothetical protein